MLRAVVPHRLALAIALALMLGCAGRAASVPRTGRAIGDVTLVGARSGDGGAIKRGLGLVYARDNGQRFARFLVAQDERRIASFYVRRGYFSAAVTSEITTHDRISDVTFTIVPGERAKLVRVDVLGAPEGDDAVSAAALRALIPIADGAPFDHATWEAASPQLPAALHEAGYARATVEAMVLADKQRAEAVIRVTVTPGPVSTFGEVTWRDVPDGLTGAVRARLAFAPGDRYRPGALDETRAALYALGRFALVRLESDRDPSDDVVDVTITVAESPRHELRLGGGFGLDSLAVEARALAQYAVAAWPWPLTSTRLDLRPALVVQRTDRTLSPRINAGVTLERLDLVRPRYTGAVEASFSYLEVEAYASYGPRLRLSARTPTFAGVATATAGAQVGVTGYTGLSKALDDDLIERLGLLGFDRVGALDQILVLDLRDDTVAPRRGGYVELRAEEGVATDGDSYLRLLPDARAYQRLGPVTVALRARAGLLRGDAPATRRFFGGGASGYRGLPERQLSPFAERVVDGDTLRVPYGGTALLELSGELRVPLPDVPVVDLPIAGAMFVDGGDVTESWAALALDHLHWALGLGLRVPTPIGAVRLDVAYRMTRFGDGEPRANERFAVHLSVGEAF